MPDASEATAARTEAARTAAAALWAPLRLPVLSRGEARLCTAFSRRLDGPLVDAGALAMVLVGLRLSPCGVGDEPAGEGAVVADVLFGAHPGVLRGVMRVPADLTEPVLRGVDAGDPAVPPILEAALEDVLGRLEARLGVPIAVVEHVAEAAGGALRLEVTLRRVDGARTHTLTLSAPDEMFAALEGLLGPAQGAPSIDALLAPCRVAVAIELGRVRLTVAEVVSLRPGDVVLSGGDDLAIAPDGVGRPVALCCGAARFAAHLSGGALRITARDASHTDASRSDASRSDGGDMSASEPPPIDATGLEEDRAGLDGVELIVTFEIARQSMTFAELRRLAPRRRPSHRGLGPRPGDDPRQRTHHRARQPRRHRRDRRRQDRAARRAPRRAVDGSGRWMMPRPPSSASSRSALGSALSPSSW